MIRLFMLLCLIGGAKEAFAQSQADLESASPEVWNASAPLELKTAQRIALRDHPSLSAARDRVEQAKARVRQAQAAYWPSLDASVSYSETWLSDGQIDSQRWFDPSPDDSPETYQAGLEAGWLLFDGFGRRFQNAAARFGVEESKASHREASRLLASAVAGSFFAAQLARENIAIAEANEACNLAPDAGSAGTPESGNRFIVGRVEFRNPGQRSAGRPDPGPIVLSPGGPGPGGIDGASLGLDRGNPGGRFSGG
jgi:hypothetical protein